MVNPNIRGRVRRLGCGLRFLIVVRVFVLEHLELEQHLGGPVVILFKDFEDGALELYHVVHLCNPSQPVVDQSAKRHVVAGGEREVQFGFQLGHPNPAVDDEVLFVFHLDVAMSGCEFVFIVAHDLFQNIFQGDQALCPAKFV